MAHVLLTGAGFSRNWGGWLATEAFEYLLGCPEVDDHLRHLLWKCKGHGGGFEDALAELQLENSRGANPAIKKQLDDLEDAIVGMFNAMNNAFERVPFEPQNDRRYLVRTFLIRFDAIFTLNQDLLLERHYLDENIGLAADVRRWGGWEIPGTELLAAPYYDPRLQKTGMRRPTNEADFKERGGYQPYYKLHGSTNWTGGGGGGGRLLIMGGNKAAEIQRYPLLNWYYHQFQQYLARATRLMIIGYSFSDIHINRALIEVAKARNIEIFIVDPLGVDVLDKQDPRPLRVPSEIMTALQPRIIGASRRPFLSAFSTDRVEFDRLSQFFEKR